jgi:hypothetical protein
MKTPALAVEMLDEIPLFPYRRADYMSLPDEPRCELIYGRFYLMTSPVPEIVLDLAEVWHQVDMRTRP